MGITYRYLHIDKEPAMSTNDSRQNFKQQFVSLIPVGFGYQGDAKFIRPYFYFGVGLSLLIDDQYHVVGNEYKGVVTDYILIPTVSLGAGVKIRAGNNFVLAEVTPTGAGGGVFINVGYSF